MGLVVIIGLIGALITILSGIGAFVKNRELVKTTLADWTRHGRKVIYFQVSYSKPGDVILNLYLCGEETSLFYPSIYENHESYVLALKGIHYDSSDDSHDYRYHAEWRAMLVKPLSEYSTPCAVQLVRENRFQFRLSNGNGEAKTVSDAFKFKTEMKECLKKCKIKYDKKASNPRDKWKAKDK